MPFIAPLLHKTAGVVVGAALALVVNDVSIGEERPVLRIQRRHFSKGEIVHKHGGSVRRIVGTSGKIDYLQARHGFAQAQRAGRVGIGANQATVPGAGANRDVRRRSAADFPRDIERSAPR